MDQVSKPVLIALAAVLVFAVAHFTVLAPKTSSGPAPQAPGMQGLGNAVGKANTAVAQSQASASRSEQAASTASGDSTAAAKTAKPATKPAATKPAATKPAATPVTETAATGTGGHW